MSPLLCQNLCKQNGECTSFSSWSYGRCYLNRRVSGQTFSSDYWASIGPRECPAAMATDGITLDVYPTMTTYTVLKPKTHHWMNWFTTSVPNWKPSSPKLAVDGDAATCFRMPAGDYKRALVLDLGSARAIDAVAVDTGGFDTYNFRVYAGETLESVGGGYTKDAPMPPPETGECNQGRHISLRYGVYPSPMSANKYFRPSPRVLRVPCSKEKVRFVAIYAMERRAFYQFCDVKVLHRKGKTWKTADKISLDPTFHLRYQGRPDTSTSV